MDLVLGVDVIFAESAVTFVANYSHNWLVLGLNLLFRNKILPLNDCF